MRVRRIASLQELQDLLPVWNRLARGVPFRTWQWLLPWWQAYGQPHELYVLIVEDQDGRPVAIAPWYLETSVWQGRAVKFLGCGEVCTDYQSILVLPAHEAAAARSLAQWLVQTAQSPAAKDRWDYLDLCDVYSADTAIERLVYELQQRSCHTSRREGCRCWRMSLPARWEHYLQYCSASQRRRMQRCDRRWLASGRGRIWTACSTQELAAASEHFRRLHQQRWERRGLPGCFASTRFQRFVAEAFPALWREGRLQLSCLEIDGKVAGAQVDLLSDTTVFAYQSGLDPAMLPCEPGRLLQLHAIRRAIEAGLEAFDFMRGDAWFKQHWGATPRMCTHLHVASPRLVAQQHGHQTWLEGPGLADGCPSAGLTWAEPAPTPSSVD